MHDQWINPVLFSAYTDYVPPISSIRAFSYNERLGMMEERFIYIILPRLLNFFAPLLVPAGYDPPLINWSTHTFPPSLFTKLHLFSKQPRTTSYECLFWCIIHEDMAKQDGTKQNYEWRKTTKCIKLLNYARSANNSNPVGNQKGTLLQAHDGRKRLRSRYAVFFRQM